MDCDDVLRLIEGYMDGSLSQWRSRAAARHLGACPPCAHEHQVHVQYRHIVASKCCEEAPLSLRVRIVDAIGNLPADPRLDGPTTDFRR